MVYHLCSGGSHRKKSPNYWKINNKHPVASTCNGGAWCGTSPLPVAIACGVLTTLVEVVVVMLVGDVQLVPVAMRVLLLMLLLLLLLMPLFKLVLGVLLVVVLSRAVKLSSWFCDCDCCCCCCCCCGCKLAPAAYLKRNVVVPEREKEQEETEWNTRRRKWSIGREMEQFISFPSILLVCYRS